MIEDSLRRFAYVPFQYFVALTTLASHMSGCEYFVNFGEAGRGMAVILEGDLRFVFGDKFAFHLRRGLQLLALGQAFAWKRSYKKLVGRGEAWRSIGNDFKCEVQRGLPAQLSEKGNASYITLEVHVERRAGPSSN